MRSRPSERAGRPGTRNSRRSRRSPSPAEFVSVEHAATALAVLADLEPGLVLAMRRDHLGREVIDGRDLPADARCGAAGLFTLSAPSDSLVVGVSFVGRPSSGEPTRIDVALTAAGSVRSQIHRDGDVTAVEGSAGGVVVDALHRMLGLPAPGPRPPLTALVAGVWLHQILAPTVQNRAPTWAEVAWAAVDPLAHLGRSASVPVPGDLTSRIPPSEEAIAAEMQELADGASWEDLRRAASIGRMRAPQLDPGEAAWMDTTMFARWMVDSFPALSTTTDVLDMLGAADIAERIRAVLRRLDPLPAPGT